MAMSKSLPASVDADRYATSERDLQRLLRGSWIVTLLLILGLGGWAATASINGAVIASGTVVVEGNRRVVQHLDGGTIAKIHVKDGDAVNGGAVLITLDARESEAAIAGLGKEISAQSAQIDLVEDELKGLLELQAKRLVAHSRVTGLQREAARLSGEIAKLSNEKAKLDARLARSQIRAPVAGRVLNLATHTVGGIIPANATIAEIVPSKEALRIEARLSPRDIDQVRSGQSAHLHMTSLNQRTTPSLEGTVEQVSADLMRDTAQQAEYYQVRIQLNKNAEQQLDGAVLLPGMPADVMIETERRSALSYLIKPLSDQIARAFREQ
jgi:multidrug efflux pump subunit AcrA (membrane-fusion protein)